MDTPFSAMCTKSKVKCRMGLQRILNKLDMASLQSSRTQCCCCAIGVFAALFGIIMLSAGICIVLNVNYMEVDTSGLPPELHNEDGKRVVGIILICVAIGSLGLSTTVSIMYFTMCNSKPRRTVTNAANANGGMISAGATNSGSRTPAATHSNRSLAHNNRGPADSHRNNSGSQHSLNSLPRRRPSPSLTPATGVRKKVQKGKKHRMRHPRYQTGLSPHIEEPETAKSQVDLKQAHGRSSGDLTDSHSNLVHEHTGTSHTVDETRRMASASDSSFSTRPARSEPLPAIIIDDSNSNFQLGTSHSPSTQALNYSQDMTGPSISFSDANMVGASGVLTEESTLFDETDTDDPEPSDSHFHPPNAELRQNSPDLSRSDTSEFVSRALPTNQTHSIPSANVSESTSQQEVWGSSSASPDSMLPSRIDIIHEREQSSLDSSSLNVVQVQPRSNSDLDCVSYSQPTVTDINQGLHGEDYVSELPPSSRHHEMYADLNSNDGERKSESRSSFNSAFSNDGGDPDDDDMKKMHEKMSELLQ